MAPPEASSPVPTQRPRRLPVLVSQVRRHALTPRPARLRRSHTLFLTPSSALRLRAAARIQSRGVVEHLRVAQLVILGARSVPALYAGGLALTPDSLLPAGKPASASAGEMPRAAGLLLEATEEAEKKGKRVGAVGSRKSWTTDSGGSKETQAMIPRAGAQVFRSRKSSRKCRIHDGGPVPPDPQQDDHGGAAQARGPPPPTTHLTALPSRTCAGARYGPRADALAARAGAGGAALCMSERSSRSVSTRRIRGTHRHRER
ncbi:hypothetical protein FB451DRAFT_1555565 [Mycena latifolia]|nr:hypothetical protein FB451DRAFT_1555565 [Mycena latifolia]